MRNARILLSIFKKCTILPEALFEADLIPPSSSRVIACALM